MSRSSLEKPADPWCLAESAHERVLSPPRYTPNAMSALGGSSCDVGSGPDDSSADVGSGPDDSSADVGSGLDDSRYRQSHCQRTKFSRCPPRFLVGSFLEFLAILAPRSWHVSPPGVLGSGVATGLANPVRMGLSRTRERVLHSLHSQSTIVASQNRACSVARRARETGVWRARTSGDDTRRVLPQFGCICTALRPLTIRQWQLVIRCGDHALWYIHWTKGGQRFRGPRGAVPNLFYLSGLGGRRGGLAGEGGSPKSCLSGEG